MISEYYIDANFLVYYFLPDTVATPSEKRGKENAKELYRNVEKDLDAKVMISYESMLEAVGVIGRRLLEEEIKGIKEENKRNINHLKLKISMANIASQITGWEQKGEKANKFRINSPMSMKRKIYQKALELCRIYSVTPLNRNDKSIGGIDAFHLAYAKERDSPGKIQSFLVTGDKALLEAAKKEGVSIKNIML